MKKFKKIASLLLALVMVCAMSVTALASDYVITVSNSVTGSTYKAYKVFDATYSGTAVAYTIKSTDAWYGIVNSGYTLNEGTDDEEYVTSPFSLSLVAGTTDTYVVTVGTYVDDEKNTVAYTVAQIISFLQNAQIPSDATVAATATGTGSSITLDVGSAGYYYITTTTGSTVTVTTAKPTASVIDKNQTPGGDLEKTASDTEAQIGDSVTYTITSSAPAYDGTTQITNYTFKDILSSGLTAPSAVDVTVQILKLDSTGSITIGEGSEAKTYSVVTTLSNAVTVSGQTITVSYDPTSIGNYPADAVIMITYTATVNAQAVYENDNTVTQTWTGDSTGITTTETVYTYGFNLKKYAESVAEGKELTGAEFQLTDGNGNVVYFTVSGTTYTVVPSTTEGATSTISAGSVTIFGLDADETYTLTETKAPNGYNKLTQTISVKVGQTDSEGNALYNTSTGINTADTTVVNNAGSELPSTGGIGTTIFYVVGTIMVLGAVVVLITRKRMSAQ